MRLQSVEDVMPVWDGVIPLQDLEAFERGSFGERRQLGDRPAVLVVDMSYGAIDASNGRGVGEGGYAVASATRRLLDTARNANLPIIFTHAMFDASAAGIGLRKGVPRAAQPDDEYYRLLSELAVKPDEMVLPKRRPSAFFGTDLNSILIFHAIDSLIVTGVATSGCVRATVVDAHSYNYRVWIPEECVTDRGLLSHKVSLFDMQMKYADVVSLSDILNEIETRQTAASGVTGADLTPSNDSPRHEVGFRPAAWQHPMQAAAGDRRPSDRAR